MSREMTNKEAISNLNHIYGIVSPDIQRSLDLAIKALEERPQGDLISRSALKEDIVKLCRQINASNGITVPTLAFTRVIDNAPTVSLQDIYQEGYYDGHLEGYTKAINEERPQGEWIDYDNTFYKCPDCGYLLEKCCPQCQNKVILPKGGAE